MTTPREYAPTVAIQCEAGHFISLRREPVEHGIVECSHSRLRANTDHCGSRLWILQLEGGRRLAVPITEDTAREIRKRRMTASEVLDMLDLLKRAAS